MSETDNINSKKVNKQFCQMQCQGDVINFGKDNDQFFHSDPMMKLEDFIRRVERKFLHISSHDWNKTDNWVFYRKEWLDTGKTCEVLHLGAKQWKKGRVRVKVTVEFCPNELESPLDDIRQKITED